MKIKNVQVKIQKFCHFYKQILSLSICLKLIIGLFEVRTIIKTGKNASDRLS
jgi:hypothetical protein